MADTIPLRSFAGDPPERPEPQPPLVADGRRLARLLCCGLRTLRTWDRTGRLPAPLRIGGRVVWRVDEIRAWLDAGAPDRVTWEARKAARK